MYLPEIRIRNHVSGIKDFFCNLQPVTPNLQQGFAILPLLVLLVVGIAAGTFLVQKGVNFLPKAQENSIPDPEDKRANPTGVYLGRPVNMSLCPAECSQVPNSICENDFPNYPSDEGKKALCAGPVTKANLSSFTYFTLYDATNDQCRGICANNQKCILAYYPSNIRQSYYDYYCASMDIPAGFVAPTDYSSPEGTVCTEDKQCQQGLSCIPSDIPNTKGCFHPKQSTTNNYCTLQGIKSSATGEDIILSKDATWIGCDTNNNKVKYTCLGNNQLKPETLQKSSSDECLAQCTLKQVRLPNETKRADIVIKKGESKEYCDTNNKKFLYECGGEGIVIPKALPDKDKECQTSPTTPAVQPASKPGTGSAPAGQPANLSSTSQASSGVPGITTTKCTADQVSKTSCTADRCVVDYAGHAWCKYPSGETTCNSTHKGACGSAKCAIISGLPRCESSSCSSQDSSSCGSNSICTTGSATVDSKPFSYTYCGPKGGTSSSGASQPGSATNTSAGQATSTECGYTEDGIAIPCYKVGVFKSDDELQATKSQASIATQRYEKSQEILNSVKGSLNKQLADAAEAAQKKLNEAKAKADACSKQ